MLLHNNVLAVVVARTRQHLMQINARSNFLLVEMGLRCIDAVCRFAGAAG